jgi:hypothetical protein
MHQEKEEVALSGKDKELGIIIYMTAANRLKQGQAWPS